MIFTSADATLPGAYHNALLILDRFGKIVPCPDYNTTIKECGIKMEVVGKCDVEPFISRVFPGGHHELQQYIMEVRDGILDFMVGAGENVWEYTYHQRIGDQLQFIEDELRRNPYSRRAVVNVRDNAVDQHNDHPACLQHIQFMIRDNALEMHVLMRSNDAWQAAFMNAVGFISIQQQLAKKLGVEVGSYSHTANSFHVYEKDFPKFERAIERIRKDTEENLTYRYEGFYKPLMEAEIPSIMAMVADQKAKYGIK